MIEVLVDAPLTPIGVIQAQETGAYLKKYVAKHAFDEIIMECSPYLRVLMTAAEIGKALDLPSIPVDYLHREWCEYDYYEGENPIPKLLIANKTRVEISEQYLGGFEYTVRQEKVDPDEMFPEDDVKCRVRVQGIIDGLCERYKESEKKVLHLIVTHGHLVNTAGNLNGGDMKEYLYCAITGLEIQSGKVQKLLYNADDTHVITKY